MPPVERPNYTQLPNALLDGIAELSDAELRVALAICRQTFGWHKERDALSLSQLERLTGRKRPAVVAGLKGLAERGWVERTPVVGRGGASFAYRLCVERIAPDDEAEEDLDEPFADGGTTAYQYDSVPVRQRTTAKQLPHQDAVHAEVVRQRTSTRSGTLAYPQKKEKENKNPPPPPTPSPGHGGGEFPAKAATPSAGGGGEGVNEETRQALKDAGVKSPSALRRLARIDPGVVRRTRKALEREGGLKSLPATLVSCLDEYLISGEEIAPVSPRRPPPPAEPPLPDAPPLDPARRAELVAQARRGQRQELRP